MKWRRVADCLFAGCWAALLLSVFEMFWDMYEAGLVSSPFWSDYLGGPCPHHVYFLLVALLILWLSRIWNELKKTTFW